MPISTDSEVWKEGKEPTRFHKKVLAFLRDHPDQAYRDRELADEVLNTTFGVGEERERIEEKLTEEKLTEEEYDDRHYEGELPGGDNYDYLLNLILLRHVEDVLSQLGNYGLIEAREVDAEPFDLPETESILVYTYDGDVDYEK